MFVILEFKQKVQSLFFQNWPACFLTKKVGILGFLEAANNVTLSFIHNTTLPLVLDLKLSHISLVLI